MTQVTAPKYESARFVIGPDGSPLTLANLPPRDTKRWVVNRKATVVVAVMGGLLSLEEACERYTLTVDEFVSWHCALEAHGLGGLKASRMQKYRDWPLCLQNRRSPAPTNLVPDSCSIPKGTNTADGAARKIKERQEMTSLFGRELPPELSVSGSGLSNVQETPQCGVKLPTAAQQDSGNVMEAGSVRLELNTQTVKINGQRIHFTRKECEFLELLMRNEGRIVTRDIFLNELYRGKREPAQKIIDVMICKIRGKWQTSTDNAHSIETVWGRGYKLQAPPATATPWAGEAILGGTRPRRPHNCGGSKRTEG
jgi:DNA-binding winged helix-turn-helix (wHTH) protein